MRQDLLNGGGLPRSLVRATRQTTRAANTIQQAARYFLDRAKYPTLKVPGGISGAIGAGAAGIGYQAAKGAKKAKNSVKTTLRVDGTSAGQLRVSKRKRKKAKTKKTLIKRVRALEKNSPPKSYYYVKDFIPYKLGCSLSNCCIWYEIPLVDHNLIEARIDALPKVSGNENYLSANTSVLISNIYNKFRMKNCTTSNIMVEYQPYVCIDDDNESVLDNIREGMINRGYTFATAPSAASSASATSAAFPYRQDCTSDATSNEVHYSPWGVYEVSRKWKKLNNVVKLIVGPGDTLDIVVPHANYHYKPEVLDDEPFSYIKKDMSLIIKCLGELSHQQTTNTNLVGYATHYFDCVLFRSFTITYDWGEGLKTVEYTDQFDSTNLTTPVHVDNQQSAVEQSVQV